LVEDKICPYSGAPCESTFVDEQGRRDCYLITPSALGRGLFFFVCCRIRFKGNNSVDDVGMGMTIFEKLKRMGLLPK